MSPLTGVIERLRDRLPQGDTLPFDIWERRHRAFVVFLWLQVVGLIGFGLYRGLGPVHSVLEGGIVGVLTAAASIRSLSRTARAVAATVGLLSTSAILVHMSNGVIEAHFHFFVMVTLITLYQLWAPFLVSIAYVVLHHGVMGTIDPGSVYNHPAAINHPFKWAVIHGTFILGATIAGLIVWKKSEEHYLGERVSQRIQLERQRKHALEMNDSIMQGLAVAAMAREVGDQARATAAVEATLSDARSIVSNLIAELETDEPLQPGDLVLPDA